MAPLDAATAPPKKKSLLDRLGPGLITGASDDDPSGIATYSQAGAQFGYALGWTLILTYPLMCAIQEISARIGRVTGQGIAGNIRQFYSRKLLISMVSLLMVANIINLGADLGAMAAALKLLVGGQLLVFVALFGLASAVLEIFISYARYASILKWLTLSLFAYVATVFVVKLPPETVLSGLFLPKLSLSADYITVIVAVFGTTISPYLFFWQASLEVEDQQAEEGAEPLEQAPEQAPAAFSRIRLDTYVGMAFSNIIALFIIITTAATLNASGVTDIQTSSQAAEALRPIAGRFAFIVFAAGIIGTGLLAVPVLAGSAAYGLGEALKWKVGLSNLPKRAVRFYTAIAVATLLGIGVNFTPLDPVKALFWTAVINGVIAVPIMVMMMFMAAEKKVMGDFTLGIGLKIMGWLSTVVMAIAVIGMFGTWLF